MDSEMIVAIAFFITATVIPLTIVSITQFTKYKLKVEQIKADAMVRVEELKLKNQLELEKLMYRETPSVDDPEFSTDNRQIREKI